MTDDDQTAAEETEAPAPRKWYIERSPIIVGAVAALIAIICLLGLTWDVLVVAQVALAWFHLALASIAVISISRGGPNVRSLVVAFIALGGFAFWTLAPELIGALPIYAYVLTAVLDIALGLSTPKIDSSRSRGVYIATAGAVVFTAVTASTRLGAG